MYNEGGHFPQHIYDLLYHIEDLCDTILNNFSAVNVAWP